MDELREYIRKNRIDYGKDSLSENNIPSNPIDLFKKWFIEAAEKKIKDANAMAVSTVNANGKPSSRIVLLRNFDENGFVFFTNYNSRKGKEIDVNKSVCLLFFWAELERQVRIEGIIRKQTEKDSDDYFNTRPKESQISAWASPQSQKVEDRNFLENKHNEYKEKFESSRVPRPEFWGGYIVIPESIEFWQGRSGRLHDRICFEKTSMNEWSKSRLAP
ncbi:MAG: pyridoxamine 5'-phosphate oxidase [Chitinophagaceae bacterium]|nr:MAG: pyridoxamine 5'-phosphate oxidase [Chitinophagaceae bacterium]